MRGKRPAPKAFRPGSAGSVRYTVPWFSPGERSNRIVGLLAASVCRRLLPDASLGHGVGGDPGARRAERRAVAEGAAGHPRAGERRADPAMGSRIGDSRDRVSSTSIRFRRPNATSSSAPSSTGSSATTSSRRRRARGRFGSRRRSVDEDVDRMRQEFPSEKAFTETLASLHTSLRSAPRAAAPQPRGRAVRSRRDRADGVGHGGRDSGLLPCEPGTLPGARKRPRQPHPHPDASRRDAGRARRRPLAGRRDPASSCAAAPTSPNLPGSAPRIRRARLEAAASTCFRGARWIPISKRPTFALEAGGVSDVVQTSLGYHVIKMHERYRGPDGDARRNQERHQGSADRAAWSRRS